MTFGIRLLLLLPFILSIWNISNLLTIILNKRERIITKIMECVSILIGFYFLVVYIAASNISFVSWNEPIYNNFLYPMVAPEHLLTLKVILLVSFISYLIARFLPSKKLPPVVSVFCISVLYISIFVNIIFCIQTLQFPTIMLSINLIIIAIKTIIILVRSKANDEALLEASKFKKLSNLLYSSKNWHILAFLMAIPILAIIVVILTLFGQEPDSIIRVWTDTAEWTFSQKIPPPRVPTNGHYLCTVAAKGHKKIVKPIRTGIRHGNEVIVNRQLCIANAFEQLISEKLPKTHKTIRFVYDKTGYPISKYITSPTASDIVYILMKPLEWFFLLSLYLFDTKPENRIAVQYPHANLYNKF